MTTITYPNDVTGSIQTTQGSDGRLNVSSRADSRAYYNSRDKGQMYSLVFDDPDAAVGDYVVYWQNTATDKDLVITNIDVNSTVACTVQLDFVTGTADTASALTPTNLNASSNHDAVANCLGNSAVGSLSQQAPIDKIMITANGHESFQLQDSVRLGQNDAIAIKYERAAGNGIVEGSIFGFYETSQ